LTSTIVVFQWKGDLFRVPFSTNQRSKREGGWDLINFLAKCRTLFITRTNKQFYNPESFTTQWMEKLHITDEPYNPPNTALIQKRFDYLTTYYREVAYIPPQQIHESMYCYRKRLYNTELYYIQPHQGSLHPPAYSAHKTPRKLEPNMEKFT
jgi:hypothetical protein